MASGLCHFPPCIFTFVLATILLSATIHLPAAQQLTTKEDADWAIVSTRVKIIAVDNNEAGSNYELWGNFRVHHNDYVMARTNIGSPHSHVICSKEQVGGARDWAGDIAQAAGAIGAGIATGGASTAVIAAGVTYLTISQVMTAVQVGPSECDDGYIATASYPVSKGTDTRPYNFMLDLREDDTWSADDVWQVDTKTTNWSTLDECWNLWFNPSVTDYKTCNYEVSTHFGRVLFETAIVGWVKGPVVDGEVQQFDNGRTYVQRRSFYGPTYYTHIAHG